MVASIEPSWNFLELAIIANPPKRCFGELCVKAGESARRNRTSTSKQSWESAALASTIARLIPGVAQVVQLNCALRRVYHIAKRHSFPAAREGAARLALPLLR